MYGSRFTFFRSLTLRAASIGVLMPAMLATAAPPAWWSQGTQPAIDPAATPANKSVANVGQAKWMANRALAALQAQRPDLAALVDAQLTGTGKPVPSWAAPATQAEKDALKAPLLLGQLKALSAPFYDALHADAPAWLAAEMTANGIPATGGHHPWTDTTEDDTNKAPATLGQLKAVFSLRFETLPAADTDGDLIPNSWEIAHGLNPGGNDASGDPDGDGISNLIEYLIGTDPQSTSTGGNPDASRDTDGDGMPDRWEAKWATATWSAMLQRTVVTRTLDWEVADATADHDSDGLDNAGEYVAGTNPTLADTDADGMPDEWEVTHFTNPLVDDKDADPDGDHVDNLTEYVLGLDPMYSSTVPGLNDYLTDRDNDGMPDPWELKWAHREWDPVTKHYVFTPVIDWETNDAAADYDGDGLSNLNEYTYGADPTKGDTDGDMLPDAWEVAENLVASDPERDYDYDLDGISNIGEYLLGTHPLDTHSAGGVLTDYFVDRDNDGMPDGWEVQWVSWAWDPLQNAYVFTRRLDWDVDDAAADYDNDGLTNLEESQPSVGTNPTKADTDDDDLPDLWEVRNATDALYAGSRNLDPDGDTVTNIQEYLLGFDPQSYSTVPGTLDNLADRDSDGMPDAWEVRWVTWSRATPQSPNVPTRRLDWEVDDAAGDYDNDGATNLAEYQAGTDPTSVDSDADGMPDGWEIQHGLLPLDSADAGLDPDHDRLTNLEEYLHGFDPHSDDTTTDIDADGLSDLWEYRYYGNLLMADPLDNEDGDGLDNLAESAAGTSPFERDTDGDLLRDEWEVATGLDPLSAAGDNGTAGDPDADGLDNLEEMIHRTQPLVADTDGGGVSDGAEVAVGGDPNDDADDGTPPSADTVFDMPFTIGDDSGSHSERWRMEIVGSNGDTRKFDLEGRNFSEVDTCSLKLRRGATYTITVKHRDSLPGYREQPDYDWTAQVGGLPTSLGTEPENAYIPIRATHDLHTAAWVATNTDGLLTTDRQGDGTDLTIGLSATLTPVELLVDTNRDSSITAADEAGKEDWTETLGANHVTNFDNDDAASSGNDSVVWSSTPGTPTSENFVIGTTADLPDITPLQVRVPTLPAGSQIHLRLAAEEQLHAMHLFGRIAVDREAIWGAATSTSAVPWTDGGQEPLDIEITPWLNSTPPGNGALPDPEPSYTIEAGTYTLGLEGILSQGMFIEGGTLSDGTFSGYLDFRLEVTLPNVSGRLDCGKVRLKATSLD
ncbi:hypothetical protein [Luteolibacter sp. LG18]|uniref:hypothetical protein n=1 Tax=Luteolibacter sp. LG18 TaxID=2819286 RepID=UPI002B31C7D0|nr:hypothetical protein llg_27340 [Luteolibacter sp. LG18]